MKLNSTVALTVILLATMLGAGYTSAIWGFTLGDQALKGVTQPDAGSKSKIKLKAIQQPKAVVMLKEEEILATVKKRIEAKGKNVKPEKPEDKDQPSQESSQQTKSALVDEQKPGFPIISKDQGVTLEVLSSRYAGGALQLSLSLKNEGNRAVNFLYSFLDVTDEQGRTLSVDTEGLPEELPANGKKVEATVSIPTALLDNVEKLSLKLTDYPDQKLQLSMSDIPVVR